MRRFTLLLALVATFGLGCSRNGSPDETPARAANADAQRPNVMLVVVDTLRADEVVIESSAADPTPNLRAIGEAGAAFTTAYAHTATTAPSHATLFTSLHPTTHGVTKNGLVLQQEHRTLTDVLDEAGYQTAAIVSGLPVVRSFGVLQGFESVMDDLPVDRNALEPRACQTSGVEKCGERTTEEAMRWLADGRDPKRPFFLFVHYYDPHKSYEAPAPFASQPTPSGKPSFRERCRAARERYRNEVAYTDHLIGKITAEIARLGLADDTLVLVTADHGEAFDEHENCQHTGDLYEELVRIPLLVRWPGKIRGGWRSSEPIGLVDVMPTVLDLLRLEAGTTLQGRSVGEALLGDESSVSPGPVFFERAHFERKKRLQGRRFFGTQLGVRDGRWKYMEATEESRRSLYDLETDPRESDNLIAERPDETMRLARVLADWRQQTMDARPEWRSQKRADSKEVVEGLRALGYVE